MTEEEWLAERKRAQWMVLTLLEPNKIQRTKAGKRKLRLFACGCCRLLWHLLDDEVLRPALEIAERYAEGKAAKGEPHRFDKAMFALTAGEYSAGVPGVEKRTAAAMVRAACSERAVAAAFDQTAYPLALAGHSVGDLDGKAALCHLLRDVFGNPFRPSAMKREWISANDRSVEAVARSIYQERAFARLPILADALEDAGCDDEAILGHCRGPGPHIRGCWVVDAILGKG